MIFLAQRPGCKTDLIYLKCIRALLRDAAVALSLFLLLATPTIVYCQVIVLPLGACLMDSAFFKQTICRAAIVLAAQQVL